MEDKLMRHFNIKYLPIHYKTYRSPKSKDSCGDLAYVFLFPQVNRLENI